MNSTVIKYVSCCKLWNKFHETDNTSLLLRFKLTDVIYYKLLQDFYLINIRFNNFNNKSQLTQEDINVIEKEVVKYNDFFDIISVVNTAMNSDTSTNY